MVCIVSTDEELYKGRRYFGQQIKSFTTSSAYDCNPLWPESLCSYYKTLPLKAKQRGLTLSMLLDWMAQETGIIEIGEDAKNHKKYETLLGRYSRWGYNPDGPGGEDVLLLSAIAHCGIIRAENGTEIRDVVQITRLINGNFDGILT